MIFYCKDKKTFETKCLFYSENYDLVIGSVGSDASKISAPYTSISQGDYITNLDDYIGIVKTIALKDAAINLSLVSMENLFDRALLDDNIRPTTSLEGYLKDRLTAYFAEYEDSFYNYPFLSISNITDTAIESVPDVDNYGCINYKKYLDKCRRLYGIRLDWTVNGNELLLNIRKDDSRKNLILDGFGYTLTDNVKSETRIAKITAINKTEEAITSQTYYLKVNGEVTQNVNDPNRIDGTWAIINYSEKDIPLEKAKEKFASNEFNHKISFTSDKQHARYQPFDNVLIQLDGDIYNSYISKMIVKSNGLISYECGELALTLSDKLNKRG